MYDNFDVQCTEASSAARYFVDVGCGMIRVGSSIPDALGSSGETAYFDLETRRLIAIWSWNYRTPRSGGSSGYSFYQGDRPRCDSWQPCERQPTGECCSAEILAGLSVQDAAPLADARVDADGGMPEAGDAAVGGDGGTIFDAGRDADSGEGSADARGD